MPMKRVCEADDSSARKRQTAARHRFSFMRRIVLFYVDEPWLLQPAGRGTRLQSGGSSADLHTMISPTPKQVSKVSVWMSKSCHEQPCVVAWGHFLTAAELAAEPAMQGCEKGELGT